MKRLFDYISDSWIEFSKVTWPSRRQAAKLTVRVVIFSLVFAGVIGALDFVFSQLLQKVILKA